MSKNTQDIILKKNLPQITADNFFLPEASLFVSGVEYEDNVVTLSKGTQGFTARLDLSQSVYVESEEALAAVLRAIVTLFPGVKPVPKTEDQIGGQIVTTTWNILEEKVKDGLLRTSIAASTNKRKDATHRFIQQNRVYDMDEKNVLPVLNQQFHPAVVEFMERQILAKRSNWRDGISYIIDVDEEEIPSARSGDSEYADEEKTPLAHPITPITPIASPKAKIFKFLVEGAGTFSRQSCHDSFTEILGNGTWQIQQPISSGSYGTVYALCHQDSSRSQPPDCNSWLVKAVVAGTKDALHEAKREAATLKTLARDRDTAQAVPAFKDAFLCESSDPNTPPTVYIVQARLDGTLRHFLEQRKYRITSSEFATIKMPVKALAKAGWVHGDLHSGNIMFRLVNGFIQDWKIIDFGRAFRADEKAFYTDAHLGDVGNVSLFYCGSKGSIHLSRAVLKLPGQEKNFLDPVRKNEVNLNFYQLYRILRANRVTIDGALVSIKPHFPELTDYEFTTFMGDLCIT